MYVPRNSQARSGADSKCGSCPGNTSAARNVLSSKSLIIVEDSDQVVRRIRSVADAIAGLEILGEAADSRTAIGLIARHRPDVVILDLQLANGSNGIDVLNYLCDHEPLVQVIVLSANVSEYRSLRRALARADHILDKMTEFHLLPKALSNSIESGETRKRGPATESTS
jgi:DNA-binding NarL/FixJ family response regulator